MKHLLQQFLLTLLFIGVGFQVTAATVTWDGGAGTNNWTDAMNWDTDALPTAADDVDLAGATVVLTANTQVLRIYAGGSTHLTINSGVTLTINNNLLASDGNGALEIQGSATLINDGIINISNTAGTSKGHGLYNKGTSTNNGTIAIDDVATHGLYVVAGTFTNGATGIITVTNVGDDNIYIDDANSGTLFGSIVNNGNISITMTTGDDGIYVNDNTTFDNNSIINISLGVGASGGDEAIFTEDGGDFKNNSGGIVTISSSKDHGISAKNNGVITNNFGGTINIDAVNDDQIFLDAVSTFNNSGLINLTNGSDIGLYVTDESVFTNTSTGVINITDAGDHGVYVDGNATASTPYATPNPILNNAGTITVNGGNSGFDGVRLTEVAEMNNTGTLNINSSADEGIELDNPSTLNNSGTIEITGAGDHGMEVGANFNNQTGGIFKAMNCADDGIRVNSSSSVVVNDGAIMIDGSGSEDIEVSSGSFTNNATATFAPGSSPGDLEIRDVFDLGTATVTFEINGPTAGTDFDQILNANGTGVTSTLTITSAKIHLNWASFVPEIGDKFMIISGSGPVSGTFATITTSNSDVVTQLNYTATGVEVEVMDILPVEMTYFKGNATAEGNLLQWETLSEQINEGFEVQKSIDGKNWEVIGFVEGNGTTIEVSNYEYLDENANEVNYYRLKQLDFDGAFEYSKTILMSNEATEKTTEKATVRTYPNPVTNQLTIEEFKGMVTIYNILGQPLKTFNVTNDVTSLPLSDLENGQYFIEMKANDGTKTVRQIVKIAE